MDYLISISYVCAIIASTIIAFRSYKNRFLPMAVPIVLLSGLMMALCLAQFSLNYAFESLQSLGLTKPISLFSLSVSFLILPFWFWLMGEYKASQKKPFKTYWWLLVEPVIAIIAILFNKIEFIPVTDQSLVKQIFFVDNYGFYHRAYMNLMGVILILWSVNVIHKKTKNNLASLIQFTICISIPMLLFIAYRDGYITKPIGATALIFILVWAAKESSLLDIIPSALSGVINRVDAGVMVFNAQKKMVFRNQFSLSLFEPDSIKNGQVLPDVLSKHFDTSLSTAQSAQLTLNKRKNKSDMVFVDASLQPIINIKTKQNLGFVVLLQDISDRKNSELALAKTNQALIDIDRQKSDFFAGVSHDFRTPLTLIIGGLDDVLEGEYGPVPFKQQQALASIKANNQRLLSLVAQLLELSQLDDGAITFKPEEIDLPTYLPSIIANFESVAAKQNTKIYIKNSHNISKLNFDIDALDKIFTNLLSNALKSIQGSGEIHISIDNTNTNKLSLSVRDTGHGIAESELPYIFDAFYHRENHHPQWPAGTGVGLHFVQQLLSKNNASITVKSTLNEGSVFTIFFERQQMNAANVKPSVEYQKNTEKHEKNEFSPSENKPRKHEQTPYNTGEKLVLVVEDNVEMRRYIRHHLTKEFRLIEAEDGDEGFILAKHSVPDLIITDITMPKLNGLELSEQLRLNHATSHIPIIVLTAQSMLNVKVKAYDIGVDDFLIKPFSTKELSSRIHNLINSREALQRLYQESDGIEPYQTALNNPSLPEKEALFIGKLRDFVLNNISNKNVLIPELASYVHMSDRSLNRKLNAITGLSPKQWLLKIKLDYAAHKLRNGSNSITEIAFETGFSDSSHFSKAFKNQHAVSPQKYREAQ